MQRSVFFSKNSHKYKYNVIHPQKTHEKKLNYVILNANFQYNILKYVFWVFSSIWQMNRALKNKRNFLLKKKTMGFPPECLEELILQEQNSTLNRRLSVLCVMCVFARALLFNLGCSAIYRSSCITNHRNAQQPLQRWFNSLRYLLLKFLYTNTHTLAHGIIKITEYNDIFIHRQFTICYKSQISRTLKTHFRFILIQLNLFGSLNRVKMNLNWAFDGYTKQIMNYC